MNPLSFLSSVAEVTAVAEARHNIFVGIESLINGGAPDRGAVGGECFLDMLYALGCCQYAGYLDAARHTFLYECFVAQFHASASGKHRVGDDECLVLQRGRGEIFHMDAYLGVRLISVSTVGTHKGIVGMVEDIEEALVEG